MQGHTQLLAKCENPIPKVCTLLGENTVQKECISNCFVLYELVFFYGIMEGGWMLDDDGELDYAIMNVVSSSSSIYGFSRK